MIVYHRGSWQKDGYSRTLSQTSAFVNRLKQNSSQADIYACKRNCQHVTFVKKIELREEKKERKQCSFSIIFMLEQISTNVFIVQFEQVLLIVLMLLLSDQIPIKAISREISAIILEVFIRCLLLTLNKNTLVLVSYLQTLN